MALHWRPVGPEPAQTYWQRRAVVAVLALLVLLLLVLLLRALFGGGDDRLAERPAALTTPSATPSLTPGASPSATGSPTPSASAVASASGTGTPTPTASGGTCGDDALEVDAAAEQGSYAVGGSPRLELRVTNTASAPCDLDLGQAAVELVVLSGDDRIWSSDDCAPGGDADVTTLEPGAVEVSRVTWPGTRSRPGCDGDQERARAGTYRVEARVGERRVQGESFVLR